MSANPIPPITALATAFGRTSDCAVSKQNRPSARLRKRPRAAVMFLAVLLASFCGVETQGQLSLEARLTGNLLQLRWNGTDSNSLLRIERTASLTAPDWRMIGLTVASQVDLDLCGATGFYRIATVTPAVDTTDYDQDRPAMAQFYGNNPLDYWTQHGLPAGTRLATMRSQLGLPPWDEFSLLAPAFRPMNLQNALQQGTLPPEVTQRMNQKLNGGAPLLIAFFETVTELVAESDQLRFSGQPNHPRRSEIRNLIAAVFQVAFDVPALGTLAPPASKPWTNAPPARYQVHTGVHGMDTFTPSILACVSATTPPLPADTDTSTVTNWAAIPSPSLWKTTYNAACAAAAVGASAVSLGVFPPEMNCKLWNEFSLALGATPGIPGAPVAGISAWYAAHGFACVTAKNGPVESAREEARKAHQRGCDVLLIYSNDAHTRGHVEKVAGFPVDAANDKVSTVSWGEVATVAVSNGRFSGKTDWERYSGDSFASGYWLGNTGEAYFVYYCPK